MLSALRLEVWQSLHTKEKCGVLDIIIGLFFATCLASGGFCYDDNLCKQFEPESGLFDTLITFLKDFLKKKSTDYNKSMNNYQACRELTL